MASIVDRRKQTRVAPGEKARLTLTFTLEGQSYEFVIEDLSKSGLRAASQVAADKSQLDALKASQVAKLVDVTGEIHDIRLVVIEVQELTYADKKTRIRALLDDEKSRAMVWRIIYAIVNPVVPGEKKKPADVTLAATLRVPEKGVYTEDARLKRLEFIENIVGQSLPTLRNSQLVAQRLSGNIENHVGGVEIPVGLAGPLLFNGGTAQGYIYAPFATSEGALVASASRGAQLLSESGGVATRTISQRMNRVPMFAMNSLDAAIFFGDWLKEHMDELQQVVTKVSKHARIIDIDVTLTGRFVHASFIYATGDAAGQNMTTAATWHACQWALNQIQHFPHIAVENFFIEAGMSSDKKVNFKSFLDGRGIRVIAEAFIEEEKLRSIMKVSSDDLVRYFTSGLAAMAQAGAIGANVNVANTIAAIFVATGQDIACVHESSLATLHIEKTEGGVYATMHLPALIVGTVGGGSGLPQQSDYLKLMGCSGPNKASRLAEIIAGYCLALDLSTASALVNGAFVKAHERLGRNRPVTYLKESDLNQEFFETAMRAWSGTPDLKIKDVVRLPDLEISDSIVGELTARGHTKLIGIFPFQLKQGRQDLDVVVKSKPIDAEVILLANKMAGMCGKELGSLYESHKYKNEARNCHIKELAIYNEKDPRFTRYVPRIHATVRDESREIFVIIMENLRNAHTHMTSTQPEFWNQEKISAVVEGMAHSHGYWFERLAQSKDHSWLGHIHNTQSMLEQVDLFKAQLNHAVQEFPEIMRPEVVECFSGLINSIGEWWGSLEKQPRTLVHNDCNPRNMALREGPDGFTVCFYDWELATLHHPTRDLAEFLVYTTTPTTDPQLIESFIEQHRQELEKVTGRTFEAEQWRRTFDHSVYHFVLSRLFLYLMAHTFRSYDFMPGLVENCHYFIANRGHQKKPVAA
ncbi:phosphotransferase [Oligoflexus tunisiensis]|uniref:phosphotransferase n=1 Tax=Oligoflexus tunisiensis TaxID=708132 RepID=UPI000A73CC61|nr:phosphotransferase [Oligoflexus tunisiensis]